VKRDSELSALLFGAGEIAVNTDSTFREIVVSQGGLTRRQKAELENRYIRECKGCTGSECDSCGGSGVRKKCDSRQCLEHGCGGYGNCEVTSREITELLATI